MRVGGVVLCGGKSSRMGTPKCWLPWGNEMLLQRIVRVVSAEVDPVVVVAAKGQELPPLPQGVLVLRDEVEGMGPLGGLMVALRHLRESVNAVFLCSCDAPFLSGNLIRYLTLRAKAVGMVMVRAGGYHHPLAAIYPTHALEEAQELLKQGRLRPFYLLERCGGLVVEEEELLAAGIDLQELENINTPEDYEKAVKNNKQGFS